MHARLFSLMTLFVLSAAAEPIPDAASPETPVARASPRLQVARNGEEVLLSWELPLPVEIRTIEVYRNDKESVKGRKRVTATRNDRAYDILPEARLPYWYWLKILLVDGQVVNVGPVVTPPSTVWTP
jgi:hypothetical protein